MATSPAPALIDPPLSGDELARIEHLLQAELQIARRLEECCAAQLADGPASAKQPDANRLREQLEAIELEHSRLERQHGQTLAEMQKLTDGPVRLSRLVARAPGPAAERLLDLRRQLLDKLVRIRSMTLAAQIALAWRLDHYRQLHAAMGGVSLEPCSFLPDGRPASSQSPPAVIEDC